MVKAGDLVEFKTGHQGIDAPDNLGVMLKRELRKGTPWLYLMTKKGKIELKQEHLTRKKFQKRFDGDLRDEANLQGWVVGRVRENSGGQLAEELETELDHLELELWEKSTSLGAPPSEGYSTEELAKIVFGDDLTSVQRKSVLHALEPCRKIGRGRFKVGKDGDHWLPWMPEEMAIIRQGQVAIDQFRQILFAEEDNSNAEARREERALQNLIRRGRSIPELSAEEQARIKPTLAWLLPAMVQEVEWDGSTPRDEALAGYAGLPCNLIGSLDLQREMANLCRDYLDVPYASRSSDIVQFLLESRLWVPSDAVRSLSRRHVNKKPHFAYKIDHQVEAEVATLPEPALEAGRDDLRHLECYTIDPEDAKDFDDAVGVTAVGDGWELWVHIADVGAYVKQGTALDRAAKSKATSVYLPGLVLPMLPSRLSDHLCSLRDDGDRFALSVQMEVSAKGVVRFKKAHRSLIRVTKNLHYADALKKFEAGDPYFKTLFECAQKIKSGRRSLGIDQAEIRVQVGETFSGYEKRGNAATQMIEAFMVACNQVVAQRLENAELPILHRSHPLPDKTRVERFQEQMVTLGLDLEFDFPSQSKEDDGPSLLEQLKGGSFTLGGFAAVAKSDSEPEPQKPLGFAQLSPSEQRAWIDPFLVALDEIQQMGDISDVAQLKLLQSMERAYYTDEPIGHFGLGLEHYCHFTSPIRRYPDLVVHRQLAWLIEGKNGPQPYQQKDVEGIRDHCSAQEREASSLEVSVKTACLVLATLSEGVSTKKAKVTGVNANGIQVQTVDGISAWVPMRDVAGGPYESDDCGSMLFLPEWEANRRISEADLRSWRNWSEGKDAKKVRAIIGDSISVKLTSRNVGDGKTNAAIDSW